MNFAELGKQLRLLRAEQGISQQLMAQQLGISRATLSAFEAGRSGDIGLKKVIAMFGYLGYELTLRDKTPLPTFEELLNDRE